MRYVIFGDMHGEDPRPLAEVLEPDDVIICLGDFDQTSVIHGFLEMSEGYKTIVVPGNHDYGILHYSDDVAIHSETLESQGKTTKQLHEELVADPVALDFMKRIIGETRYTLSLGDFEIFRTLVMHGALAGSFRVATEDAPDGLKVIKSRDRANVEKQRILSKWLFHFPNEMLDTWIRILDQVDVRENFERMYVEGIAVMIRGHDHFPSYATMDNEHEVKADYDIPTGTGYEMRGRLLHLINPGAWYNRRYAIIEPRDQFLSLDFFELPR